MHHDTAAEAPRRDPAGRSQTGHAPTHRGARRGAAPLASLLVSTTLLIVALPLSELLSPPLSVGRLERLGSLRSVDESLDVVAATASTAVVAILAYLVLLSALATLAALAPRSRFVRLAQICTPRILGALVAGTVAITATPAGATGHEPAPPEPGAGATMRVIDAPADGAGAPTGSDTAALPQHRARSLPTTPRPRTSLPWIDEPGQGAAARSGPQRTAATPPLDVAEPPGTTDTARRPDGADEPAPAEPAPPEPAPGELAPLAPEQPPSRYTVQIGDHLWSIAERVVTRDPATHAAPSDRRIGEYWQALIDANRDRVEDPDLIMPGQELVLPPGP